MSKPVRGPGAVVVGGYINALGLVRALAARDIPVAVIVTKPFDIAHRSRWAHSHEVLEGLAESPERLVDLLQRRSAEWSGWLVIPTNDEALRALAQYHDRLSTYRLACPDWDVVPYFLDKAQMLDVTRAIGIPAPRCYGFADEAALESGDLRYPVVIKPVSSYPFVARFGAKLFVANNRVELRAAVARLSEARLRAQVFDLIPGDDGQIYVYCTYIDTRGEPRGGLTVRKLRQGPPFFGSARVAEITPDQPMLCEMTLELMRRIGFRGFAAMEFKLDPRDATFRFMEVNGRSVVYNLLLRRAGMDVAGLLWADHVNGESERVQPNNWAGVWVHLHADLLYSMFYRRHDRISLGRFLAPYRRPTIDAVWSTTDPAPSVAEWLWSARRAAGAWRRSGRRRLLADPTVP